MPKKSLTPSNPSTCQFPFADGRRCQMPVAPAHPYLCLFHADRERRLAEQARLDSAPDPLVAELTSLSGEIKTANDLNRVLTRLWSLVVARRLDRRTASNLAYIGALILQTLPGVKSETREARGYQEWERTLLRAFPAPSTIMRTPSDSNACPSSSSQPASQSQVPSSSNATNSP